MLHQDAGLFVHASPCTQRWPSTTHLLSSPIAPVVITLGVFDDSVMDSSRVALWLHPSSVRQSLLELFKTGARSVAVALHGNLKHHQLFDAEPLSLLSLKRLARHLSFNLDAISLSLCAAAHFSRNSQKQMPTTTENDRHCKSQRQGDNKHRTDRCGSCFKSDNDVSLP